MKIMITYGGVFIVTFILAPIAFGFLNVKTSPLFPLHRFLDTISTLVIMIPFFLGINAMNVERLKFARRYTQEENWRGVYGATESFAQLGQNWLDRTGEAHYLLAAALDKLGHKADAEKQRQFVVKYRTSSPWAAKLREVEAGRTPRKISDIKANKSEGRNKLMKAKRRF